MNTSTSSHYTTLTSYYGVVDVEATIADHSFTYN